MPPARDGGVVGMSDYPLVATVEEMRNVFLDRLFNPKGEIGDIDDLTARSEALVQLTAQYLASLASTYLIDDLIFEPHGIRAMLGRFQRDAFGISRLWQRIDDSVQDSKLDAKLAKSIKTRCSDWGCV